MPPFGVGCSVRRCLHRQTLVSSGKVVSQKLLFAVRALSRNKGSFRIHLKLDNQTAVLYINHMGGTRSPPVEQSGHSTMDMVPGQGNNLVSRTLTSSRQLCGKLPSPFLSRMGAPQGHLMEVYQALYRTLWDNYSQQV